MQTREDILQKLESVTATESSQWKKRKAANPKALEKSRIIAINILAQLRKLGMSQKDLAEKLQVTPQTMNFWVKGNSSFRFRRLCGLRRFWGLS